MAQAPNKLFSRGEIRNILTELSNDCAMLLVTHRDSFSGDSTHNRETCRVCLEWKGRVEGLRSAVRHFGGRR